MKNKIPEDNYLQALMALKDICNQLYGGYYEPKSTRDKQLADELFEIYNKHAQEMEPDPCPQCVKGGVCSTPTCKRLSLPPDHPYRKPHEQTSKSTTL